MSEEPIKILGVQRFFEERMQTRSIAVDYLKEKGKVELCIETHAGTGEGMGKLYAKEFPLHIKNDMDKQAPTDYHLDAYEFIGFIKTMKGISLLDVDAYGMCNRIVDNFLATITKENSFPIVICTTNCLGLGLKRCGIEERKRRLARYQFLDSTQIDEFMPKPYNELKKVEGQFWINMSRKHHLLIRVLEMLPSQNKNFIFSTVAIEGKFD